MKVWFLRIGLFVLGGVVYGALSTLIDTAVAELVGAKSVSAAHSLLLNQVAQLPVWFGCLLFACWVLSYWKTTNRREASFFKKVFLTIVLVYSVVLAGFWMLFSHDPNRWWYGLGMLGLCVVAVALIRRPVAA